MIFNFLFSNLKNILIVAVSFFGMYILRRNKNLSIQNQQLVENSIEKDKVINIQAKVLDVTKNIKYTDLDRSLDRLSDKTK